MRDLINSAVAEGETKFKDGTLDVIKLGQEDEATPDEDGVPWGCEADEGAGWGSSN